MLHHAQRKIYGCIVLICVSLTSAMNAGEAHFIVIFASQSIPNQAQHSHSFATFVRAIWEGDGPRPPNARHEIHTISWMPANGRIRTLALLPELGHNFDLSESLNMARDNNQHVSMWGPYQIQVELYQRALARKAELENGNIKYKAIDGGNRNERICNCIHAVSRMVERPRPRPPIHGWGDSASYYILQVMEPWIISKSPEMSIGSALGLDQRQLTHRDWENETGSDDRYQLRMR